MAKPSITKPQKPYRVQDLEGKTWVGIGNCAGTFEAVRHVQAVLALAGIEPSIEGSVMYGICVLEPDVPRALDLLKEDEDASIYKITLHAAS
jgi:hypothetical protein